MKLFFRPSRILTIISLFVVILSTSAFILGKLNDKPAFNKHASVRRTQNSSLQQSPPVSIPNMYTMVSYSDA